MDTEKFACSTVRLLRLYLLLFFLILIGCFSIPSPCRPSSSRSGFVFIGNTIQRRLTTTFTSMTSVNHVLSTHATATVLVMGSCGLDRLLGVSIYPSPDAKVRTTSYHEMGGGNAANTASAMALLAKAAALQPNSSEQAEIQQPSVTLNVQLCSKVGDDYIGKQLVDELEKAGVDLSNPLFQVGKPGTTTGFTTVVVSENEKTRTCIHTPGTCGELTMQDLEAVNLDEVFSGVIHFHSDARHTDVALVMAKEAHKRCITVSLDVEKDRNTRALDHLLEEADLIFTNSQQLEEYLGRLTMEYEQHKNRAPLRPVPDVVIQKPYHGKLDANQILYAMRPSFFFTRWHQQKGKLLVITKGAEGAISVRCNTVSSSDDDSKSPIHDEVATTDRIEISSFELQSGIARVCPTELHHMFLDRPAGQAGRSAFFDASYTILCSGVLSSVNVVDTTGAGDAFIGGYLLALLLDPRHLDRSSLQDVDPSVLQTALQFGSWVGGKKLEGPGARSSLPTAGDLDSQLGDKWCKVQGTLSRIITEFIPSPQTVNRRYG